MMFFKQALAFALMSFTSVEARKTFSKQDFADAVAAGRVDHGKLMQNAVPYHKDGSLRRRAEDQNQNQNQNQNQQYNENSQQNQADNAAQDEALYNGNYDDYQRANITANFRLQFSSCLTMETENYNLFLDNLVGYAKAGSLLSVRNYIIFDVCDGDDCEAQTWMVDLLTFIEAVVAYGPARKDVVCEACQTYGSDVCGKTYFYSGQDANADADGQDQGDEDNQEQDNGGRRLQFDYQVFDEDMCTECENFNCGYDNNGDQQYDYEAIEGWIAEIAECKETGAQWNGLNTYAGWMCNSDGSGIEVGVFIDEYCRMYQRNLQYSSVMQDEDYQYFYQSQDIIPFMFTDIIECKDLSSVQYVDQDTYDTMDSSQADYSDGSSYGTSDTVSEACQALFYGDFVPRSMSSCGESKNWTAYEMAQQQNTAQNQNGDNGQYNSGQNMYQYIQAQQMMYNSYGQDTSWYQYDLDSLSVLDGASVCEGVQSKWQDSGVQNAFNDEHTDNGFWKWASGSKSEGDNDSHWLFPTRNNNSAYQTAGTKLSPMEIAWIVIGSVALTAMFMHLTRKQILKRKIKNESSREVYIKTDDKGSPLIIS